MIEYMPWSKAVFSDCLKEYAEGCLNILDIELGGQCNYHCIYCDSPSRNKYCSISIEKIEKVFCLSKIKWVFICGLGEPTYADNATLLKEILKLCEKYNSKCSIFTNLSRLDEEIESYISMGILNILFKYDSRNITDVMNLYGIPSANKQVYNINRLKKIVKCVDNCTNLGASIVPTKINKDKIIDIVKDCLDNNIYPLIAELENSGEAQNYYDQLSLSNEELWDIKKEVSKLIDKDYCIPICPSVIFGMHIRYDGKVTVDEFTGLSCHWFWLEEPRTKVIGDFHEEEYEALVNKIIKYRMERIQAIKCLLNKPIEFVFGGCGGDVAYMLNHYLNMFCGSNL